MNDYCNIVDPIGTERCESPPGMEGLEPPVRTHCYQCGLPVCRSCSAITIYRRRRVRLCSACIEENKR